MIVKFSTRFGQLTMHGDAAVALLKAMGHTGSVPGAILAAELPAALEALQRSLATYGDRIASAPPPDLDDEEREREPVVTLRMRAVPLIELVQAAVARDSDLMWERA
ncbi:MAG: DUF1840 domain-containing protein [Gammaproteobacteria bacterium]|nr:DUF1840 domain-containing protein [Gammaproteobacteria bacterium]